MEYLQVSINAAAEEQEWLSAIMLDQGFEGVLHDKKLLKAYISKEEFNHSQLTDTLETLLPGRAFSVVPLPDRNWNSEWEGNFNPVQVDNVCIRAPHHVPSPADIEVIIQPQMSFGTGHHDTTALMVRQQLHLGGNFEHVLDFGAGTGVLAILGEKIGYHAISAIDIETNAVANIKENIALNGCERIQSYQGDIQDVPIKPFGLILANVTRNIIVDRLAQFQELLLPKGYLVISGFFEDDVNDLIEAAKVHRMNFIRTLYSNTWASVILVKI